MIGWLATMGCCLLQRAAVQRCLQGAAARSAFACDSPRRACFPTHLLPAEHSAINAALMVLERALQLKCDTKEL